MTTVTMHPKTVDRLAKLAGMIGSSHDGEVVNAARLLHRELCGYGLTFDRIVRAGCRSLDADEGCRPDDASDSRTGTTSPPHRPVALWALKHPSLLSDKEAGFLRNIARQAHPPSLKQQDWLDGIVDRLRSVMAA